MTVRSGLTNTTHMHDQFRLIPVSNPQWAAWVDGTPHDFHHTAAHHLVWQEKGDGEAWLAVYGTPARYIAWPYLLRKIDIDADAGQQNLFDITAVDGYCGPLIHGCASGDPFVADAMRLIFEQWRAAGV